jgi:hypothetical protein
MGFKDPNRSPHERLRSTGAERGRMLWIPPLTRRGAMRRFLKQLPCLLSQDYGHRGPYTPEQVESTLQRQKIAPPKFWLYALVIFCDEENVRSTGRIGEKPYESMRAEVAAEFFAGDVGFSARDAIHYAEAHGGHVSSETAFGHETGGHGGSHH